MPSVKGLLDRLNPWHEKPSNPPPITVRTAVLLIALYALAYFLPFYLSSTTRPSPTLSRDAPSVIRARIRFVALTCLGCCLATALVLARTAQATAPDVLHLMGLYPPALLAALRALGLTMLLFAGPLFAYLFVDDGVADWLQANPLSQLREVWDDWATYRNLVAGPVTEEVLFRAASVPLMLLARASAREVVLLSPVVFGLAHCHHFYEFRLTNPGVPLAAALARSLFQFAFTTVFGAYATFLYVRTASLPAVCLVHAFCNCMGLPRLWGRLNRPPAVAPEEAAGGRDEAAKHRDADPGAGWLKWTVAYYVILVAGAVAFYRNLWFLTESENALMPRSAFGLA